MEDVIAAISVRADKVQKGEKLTAEDIEILERGMLTINTLNRIENKQAELKEILVEMGYGVGGISNSVWDDTGIFKPEDFDRILENEQKLKNAFFVYSSTPSVSSNNYRLFSVINEVEKILDDIEKMADDVKANYRICGVAVCGE
jgi:hypothetical protein